jgi:hypothetical protein
MRKVVFGAVLIFFPILALAQPIKLSDSQVQALGCLDVQKAIETHQNCSAVAAVDLTAAYHMRAQWKFVVTQENPTSKQGDLQFAFLKNGAPFQVSANSAKFGGEYSTTPKVTGCPNEMRDVSLVHPTKIAKRPLVVVNAICFTGAPNQPDFLGIWAYSPASQRFEMIWGSITACGEAARLFSSGSLAGYLVSDTDPVSRGDGANPYQIIDVYRLMPDQRFSKVLSYRHFYNDLAGPIDICPYFQPDALIDRELPTIFARLGLSRH